MARHKNAVWNLSDSVNLDTAKLAVLMDICDELHEINSKLGCYRIPRALDALIEVGQDIRRKKRARRKRNRERRARE